MKGVRCDYRGLVELLNMPPDDYTRFLNFLRKHHCHLPFQQFRSPMVRSSEFSTRVATPVRQVSV